MKKPLFVSLICLAFLSGCETSKPTARNDAGYANRAPSLVAQRMQQRPAYEATAKAAAPAGVLGGILGSQYANLHGSDVSYANKAVNRAKSAPIGQAVKWKNPKSGHSGSFSAIRDGLNAEGVYCREFEATVNVRGSSKSAYGTACKNSSGHWSMS